MSEWENFSKLWVRMMGKPAPSSQQFFNWLRFHTAETLEAAIVKTSHRAKCSAMSLDFKIRYVSRICNQETFRLYEESKVSALSSSAA